MATISDLIAKTQYLIKKGKGFLSVSGGKYANAILGGVMWLLILKFLTQAEYGRTVYWHSTAMILSSFATMGFYLSFQTLIPKGHHGITSEGNLLSLLLTLGFAIPLTFFVPRNLFGTIFYFIFLIRYKLSIAEMLGNQKYMEFLLVSIARRCIQIGASLILYQFLGVNGVLLGLTLGVAAVSYRSFRSLLSFSGSFSFSLTRAHLSFILYTFGQSAILGLMNQLDRLLVGRFYGAELLGVYAFVAQMFTFLRMIPQGFRGYFIPEKSAGRRARLAELVGIAASVGLGVLTLVFVPVGVHWFFPKYTEAIGAIRVLSLVPIIFIFSVIFMAHFLSREESQTPFLATVIANIVRLVGVLLLYKYFGILGMGIGLVLTTCTLLVVLWLKKVVSAEATTQHDAKA